MKKSRWRTWQPPHPAPVTSSILGALVASLVVAVLSVGWSYGEESRIPAAFPLPTAMPAPPGYACPVASGYRFRNDFGDPRSGHRSHRGNDVFAERGTPVAAAVGGTVTKVVPFDDHTLGGRRVWVSGDDGWWYYYAHLETAEVKLGDTVTTAQRLGTVGNSGNAVTTPPHLHFERHVGTMTGPVVNPYQFLSALCP